MAKFKPIICSECHQPMEMVELHDVPVEKIHKFIDIPENKLEYNWYWCPKCDFYKQKTPPIKLSADFTKTYLSGILTKFQ